MSLLLIGEGEVPWYRGSLVPRGSLVQRFPGTEVPWYRGVLVPRCPGTEVSWYRPVEALRTATEMSTHSGILLLLSLASLQDVKPLFNGLGNPAVPPRHPRAAAAASALLLFPTPPKHTPNARRRPHLQPLLCFTGLVTPVSVHGEDIDRDDRQTHRGSSGETWTSLAGGGQ
ncbi:hypothetical protein CRUP_013031, partial [Coryphaenoides rupestris]